MANNVTSAKRRKKLNQQGKPVNGKTFTAGTLASYGNKRQRTATDLVETLKAASVNSPHGRTR